MNSPLEHTFQDEDLVYVDVAKKSIIGKVEWKENGLPVKKSVIYDNADTQQKKRVGQYYPWCTYRTAKKIYHVEGKFIEQGEYDDFNSVIEKALQQPYWNN